MNGADLLCSTLLANKVEVCFSNPGTSEMHFVAALDRRPEMRCILGLAETVVTGAADGYARMTGRPAATLLHLGPGLANGFSNLHNARRAGTPVVNIIGDHASSHLGFDAPLTTDIDALAGALCGWIGRAENASAVGTRAAEAIAATRRGALGRVATLILPADSAWSELPDGTTPVMAAATAPFPPRQENVRAAVEALRKGSGTLLLLGSDAMDARSAGLAARIAMATGAALMSDGNSRRTAAGAGRVAMPRVPYEPAQALQALASFDHVVLIGAVEPVSFFGYPGLPGRLLPEGCEVVAAATREEDAAGALAAIADALSIPASLVPVLSPHAPPPAPRGPINAATFGAAVAHNLADGTVVVNEAITNGGGFLSAGRTAAPHDVLSLTGGAIGIGIPLATGVAVACPDRKVVTLQADGSGMYSLQGLWTQARERLDVVTIILSNRRYEILRGEWRKVGAGETGVNASRMLDLDDPALDWVHLARGMGVDSVRVDTAEALDRALAAAMKRPGPILIEAVIGG